MEQFISLLLQRPLRPDAIVRHIKQLREGTDGVQEISDTALQHGVEISFDNTKDHFHVTLCN